MTSIRLLLPALLLAIAAGQPTAGFAHGKKAHAEMPAYDPVTTEFGEYQPGMAADRTIEVTLSDAMRFEPETIRVKRGEVIEFVHENTGQTVHEFVIGTPESLAEHAEMMKKFPGMEHDEPYMAHIQPGQTGAMLWRFSEPGEFGFGCLVPGHFDAGMKGTIVVE